MRKIAIIKLMIFFFTFAAAQSFMFYRDSLPLEDSAAFTVSNYKVYFEENEYIVLSFESGLQLKNLTGQDLQTSITQTIVEGPSDNEGGYLSFCFLDCTTGNANRTKTGVLKAHSFNEGFHVTFFAYQGKYNRIKVKYDVFLTNALIKTDKKTVTVTYLYDEKSTTHSIKPVEKPELTFFQVGSHVVIHHSFALDACQLEIYNLMGRQITRVMLPAGQGAYVLPEILVKGIYIYVVKNRNQIVASQKFVVNK